MFALMNDKSRRGVDWNKFWRWLGAEYLQIIRQYIIPVVFNRSLLLGILVCYGAEVSYFNGLSDANSSGAVIAMALMWVAGDMVFVAMSRATVDSRPVLGDFRAAWKAGGEERKSVIYAVLYTSIFVLSLLVSRALGLGLFGIVVVTTIATASVVYRMRYAIQAKVKAIQAKRSNSAPLN